MEDAEDLGKRMTLMEGQLLKATAAVAEAARQEAAVAEAAHQKSDQILGSPRDTGSLFSESGSGGPRSQKDGRDGRKDENLEKPSYLNTENSTLLNSGPASPLEPRVPSSASLGASSVGSGRQSSVGSGRQSSFGSGRHSSVGPASGKQYSELTTMSPNAGLSSPGLSRERNRSSFTFCVRKKIIEILIQMESSKRTDSFQL